MPTLAPTLPHPSEGRQSWEQCMGHSCPTVIRNNFICFICCLIISSTLA